MRNRSKRVRTPVALLCSLSGKYPWERYEPPYPPSYGLNSKLLLNKETKHFYLKRLINEIINLFDNRIKVK